MGRIDSYLTAQVTPQLFAGEQIMGVAHLREAMNARPGAVPTSYNEWLATATNMRLVLFKTKAGGAWRNKPEARCDEVINWSYQDLKSMTMRTFGARGGTSITLTPHPGAGPLDGKSERYDVFPTADGLDAHPAFVSQYAPWLAQQIAQGAYPMSPQREAELQALEQQRQAMAHETQMRQAHTKQVRAARRRAALARGTVHRYVGVAFVVLSLLAGVPAWVVLTSPGLRPEGGLLMAGAAFAGFAIAVLLFMVGNRRRRECVEGQDKPTSPAALRANA